MHYIYHASLYGHSTTAASKVPIDFRNITFLKTSQFSRQHAMQSSSHRRHQHVKVHFDNLQNIKGRLNPAVLFVTTFWTNLDEISSIIADFNLSSKPYSHWI